VIRISGTCNESVLAEDFDDLTITGLPGATLISTTTGLDSAALTILGSRNVTISDMTIDGGEAVALRLHTCQLCVVQDVSMTGGVDAINVRGPSSARISGIDASGLTGSGIAVREQAWVELSDSVFDGGGTAVWGGVWVHRGGVVSVSAVTARGFRNGFAAGGDGAGTILGDLEPGEEHTIRLEDNYSYGIWTAPDGQVRISYIPIVISNNGRGGVASYDSSVVLDSDVEISGHPFCGVEAGENATVWLGNALINGSRFGIWAHRKSLVRIAQPVTISDSTENAIFAIYSSQVAIGETVTLAGNAHDVTCDALSEIVDWANLDTGGNPLQADCPNLH
jgi:hypothetical protein